MESSGQQPVSAVLYKEEVGRLRVGADGGGKGTRRRCTVASASSGVVAMYEAHDVTDQDLDTKGPLSVFAQIAGSSCRGVSSEPRELGQTKGRNGFGTLKIGGIPCLPMLWIGIGVWFWMLGGSLWGPLGGFSPGPRLVGQVQTGRAQSMCATS